MIDKSISYLLEKLLNHLKCNTISFYKISDDYCSCVAFAPSTKSPVTIPSNIILKVLSNKPIIIKRGYKNDKLNKLLNIDSLMLIPIIINNDFYGFLISESVQPRNWSADDLSSSLSCAADITIAIEKELSLSFLSDKNQELKIVQEISDEMVLRIDKSFNIISVTDNVTRITGYTPKELIGTNISEYISPEMIDQAIEGLFLSFKKSRLSYSQLKYKDGTYRWNKIVTRPIINQGKFDGSWSVLTSVEELFDLREENSRMQSQFDSILNYSKDILWIVETQNNQSSTSIKLVSPSVETITGCSPYAVINPFSADETANLLHQSIILQSKDIIDSNRHAEMVININNRKLNKEVHLESKATLIHDVSSGKPSKIVGIMRDITPTIKKMKSLSLYADRLKSLVDQLHETMIILSPEGIPLETFGNIYLALGYKPEEFTHHINHFYDLVHPQDKVEPISSIFPMSTKSLVQAECRLMCANGLYRWFRCTFSSSCYDGKYNEVVVIISDIDNDINIRNFNSVIEDMNVLFWSTDSNVGFNYVSPSVQNILGYSVSDAIINGLYDTYAEDTNTKVWKLFSKASIAINRNDYLWHDYINVQHVSKNGDLKDGVLSLSILSKDGLFQGLLGVTIFS
jgi:PAS domain S-box-containing protein